VGRIGRPAKRFAYWALYGLVTIMASLLLLEGVVRLFHLAPPLPPSYGEFVEDDLLPFRSRPDYEKVVPGRHGEYEYYHRSNSLGFRDVEHTWEKPEGTFRILGLGDSFTNGSTADLEDTYLYRLEKMLQTREGGHPEIEIIKAGQSRYWPEAERMLLEVIGIRFQPDLVLVGFTPNDVTDTFVGAAHPRVREGYLVSREAYGLGPAGVWLYVHSHLARRILRTWMDKSRTIGGRGGQSEFRWGEVYVEDGFHEKDWLQVEAEYEKMLETARGIGAQMVIINIPDKSFRRKAASYPGDRLTRWGERHGVQVIDVLPAMRATPAGTKLFWKYDMHCAPAGYRIIAETAYSGLTELGLVP
jgi:hypothetical protein